MFVRRSYSFFNHLLLSFLLLASSIFSPRLTSPMSDAPSLSGANLSSGSSDGLEQNRDLNIDVDAIVANAQAVASSQNIESIVSQTMKGIEDREKEQREREKAQIKDQNTILFGYPNRYNIPVAFYKGDIVRSIALSTDILGQAYLAKNIRDNRIEIITQKIIENSQDIAKLPQKIDEAAANFDKKYAKKSFLGRMFTRKSQREFEMNKVISDYLSNNIFFIKWNPFKQELALPILANIGLTSLANFIIRNFRNNNFYYPESLKGYANVDGKPEPLKAYVNIDGSPVQEQRESDVGPLSIVTLFSLFYPTSVNMYPMMSNNLSHMSFANELFGLGLPKFLFNESFNLALRCIGFGLYVKAIDSLCNSIWTHYVITNKEQLFDLCNDFNQVKISGSIEEQEMVKEKIRKFVISGHNFFSLNPFILGKSFLNKKNFNLTAMVFSAKLYFLFCKGYYKFIRAMLSV